MGEISNLLVSYIRIRVCELDVYDICFIYSYTCLWARYIRYLFYIILIRVYGLDINFTCFIYSYT